MTFARAIDVLEVFEALTGPQKITLTDQTRTNRKPWAWTRQNELRAADILTVFDELGEWWPLTVRQAYYRLISSGLARADHWRQHGNTSRPYVKDYYKSIIRILKWLRIDERLRWNAITDEHRTTTDKLGFSNAEQFIEQELSCMLNGYGRCMAQIQDRYIEIWIEKAALLHIVKPIADEFCRRVVVCRGYNSVTFQADFYHRATEAIGHGQTPTVLYFGDWDPSGVNMLHAAIQTLEDELDLYGVDYYRSGINPEHFSEIPADPVPVKPSDTRSRKFVQEHGTTAYELDAFHPRQLQELVREAIQRFTDMKTYAANKIIEKQDRSVIEDLRSHLLDAYDEYMWKLNHDPTSEGGAKDDRQN